MKFFPKIRNLGLTWLSFLIGAVWAQSENGDREGPNSFNESPPIFFMSQIFHKYGNNNTMTYEGFEHLLENLGLGKLKFDTSHDVSIHKINGTFLEFHDELSLHKHNHSWTQVHEKSITENREKRNLRKSETAELYIRRCMSVSDILLTYGLQPYHNVVILPSNFLEICPAIVYELDQKSCEQMKAEEAQAARQDYRLVWTYATITIFVMGASGALCVVVVPLAKKKYYESLLQFLVSLGAGTLCGDALIHLLPQVFAKGDKVESNSIFILRGAVILLAIYIFYIIESTLKGIQNQKMKKTGSIYELGNMLPENDFKSHGHEHCDRVRAVAWMAIFGDILHNFTDGLSIGAAFGSDLASGFASSIAIFCHELPHELGDYAILLASGMSIKKSLFYNLLSTLFSFAGMSAGVLLGKIEDASLWINSFTAGSFLYIALSDLVPELKMMESKVGVKNFFIQTFGLSCGGLLMLLIALYEEKIENLL